MVKARTTTPATVTLIATGATQVLPDLEITLPSGIPTAVPSDLAETLLTFPGVVIFTTAPNQVEATPEVPAPAAPLSVPESSETLAIEPAATLE